MKNPLPKLSQALQEHFYDHGYTEQPPVKAMTKPQLEAAAKSLDKAADLIADKRWVQNSTNLTIAGVDCFCAAGAIEWAVNGKGGYPSNAEAMRAQAVADANTKVMSIVRYNDDANRRRVDVVNKLRDSAFRARVLAEA